LTLLEKLRDAGDALSWSRFVSLYTPFLLRWAKRMPVDGTEAVDLVQEVLIKLVSELPKFTYDSEKGRFRGWLRTVCFHCWTDLRRKRGNRLLQAADGELADLKDTDDGLEQLWQAEYAGLIVRQAARLCDAYAGEFDPQTLRAFREVVINQRRVIDVAQELGVSENAVSLAKLRVLRRLKLDLARLLD